MAKYSKKLTEKIVALIEEDAYTTTDICKIVGISKKSFYEWRITKPDFKKAVEYASEKRAEKLYLLARQALQSKLRGYTQKVSRTVYIPSEEDPSVLIIKQYVVTEKQCLPDTSTIAQALNIGDTADDCYFRGRRSLATPPFSISVDENKIKEDLNVLNHKQKEIGDKTLAGSIDNKKQVSNSTENAVSEEPNDKIAEGMSGEQLDKNGLKLNDRIDKKTNEQETVINLNEREIKEIRQEELKNSWQATPCLPPPLRGIAYRYRK